MNFPDSIQNLDLINNETIKHHFTSFINNDVKEIMSDYSKESIIITPEQEFVGLEKIRVFFTKAIELYRTDYTTIIIDKFYSSENMAYVVWHGITPDFKVDFSTATYIMENKIITKHTIGRVISKIK